MLIFAKVKTNYFGAYVIKLVFDINRLSNNFDFMTCR